MTTLSAYRVAPQMEFKAAAELRQHGIRAYVPREPGKKAPIARGYVFGAYKPAFAKHVANRIGSVTSGELSRLYLKRPAKQERPTCPYKPGQIVFRGEVRAKVIEVRDRTCIVETTMLGKAHQQSIHYSQLRPG